MFKRILVPTDGSELSSKALATALDLAQPLSAQIFTVAVKEPFPYSALSEMQPIPPQEFYDSQERIAQRNLQRVQEACKKAGLPCTPHSVEALHPWEAILDEARQNECDLIVMASHGRRGVAALLLGSETQKVLTHGKVPVLVVR
ncbi:MAG TPA: universal stress protein [Burkholderiaceae bacterium]|nr:universal stress protein [Burkholderiaceae bacterium]